MSGQRKLRRPVPGEVWVRKADRGTRERRVIVTDVVQHGTRVEWRLELESWGQRQEGQALMSTFIQKYRPAVELRGGADD